MAVEVFMPRLTHDMTIGRLLHWLKHEGDEVKIGEPLFEVETDKAVSEVQAEANGILQAIVFNEDQEVPVGAVMAYIVAKGEELPTPIRNSPNTFIKPMSQGNVGKEKNDIIASHSQDEILKERVLITPIARKLAQEYQIDIDQLQGSGPRGKIVEADVRAWIKQREEQMAVVSTPVDDMAYEVIHLSDVQRITGQRMTQSATGIPQFALEVDVNMAEAMRLRNFIATQLGLKISYTTFLIEATAKALRFHPRLNASFVEGEIRSYKAINIAVAIATTHGLLAPVIHNTDTLTLMQIQERMDYFKNLPEEKSFNINDLSRGTFTISNLGMYGIDRFTALINPPQAAILAVGQIGEKLVLKEEKPIIQSFMTLRLSVDHRVVDGAIAALFLMELKKNIECPDAFR